MLEDGAPGGKRQQCIAPDGSTAMVPGMDAFFYSGFSLP
jgi:hypothetical protein